MAENMIWGHISARHAALDAWDEKKSEKRMTVQAHTADRRLVVLAVLRRRPRAHGRDGGRSRAARRRPDPSAPAAPEQKDGNGGSSAMDGQPVN